MGGTRHARRFPKSRASSRRKQVPILKQVAECRRGTGRETAKASGTRMCFRGIGACGFIPAGMERDGLPQGLPRPRAEISPVSSRRPGCQSIGWVPSIPSVAWQPYPSPLGRLRAHSFASPPRDGFAFVENGRGRSLWDSFRRLASLSSATRQLWNGFDGYANRTDDFLEIFSNRRFRAWRESDRRVVSLIKPTSHRTST